MTVTLRRLSAEEWANGQQRSRVDPAGDGSPDDRKREAQRRWAQRNPEKAVASRLKWEAENPAARRAVWRAHAAVKMAVKRGVLVRPNLCSRCGQRGRRIEGAHDNYAKPLEVTWLCSPCHRLDDVHNPKTRIA